MTPAERFERMIRWYPPAWRARYGSEMTALLDDTHGMSRVPWRARWSLMRAGSLERSRSCGLIGDANGPDDRIRAGSLLSLTAWALFMVAGGLVAKFSEHWSAVTPKADRGIPSIAFDAVQMAGVAGVTLVLAAALVAVPAFLRLIQEGGWHLVRRPILRAVLGAAMATATTVGIVAWAHHLGPGARNGGSTPYRGADVLWLFIVIGALAAATAAVVAVGRRLSLSPATIRLLGAVAIALFLMMVVVIAGTFVWWPRWAPTAPRFLARGALSTSNVLLPPLIVAAVLMLAGLALSALGFLRVARSLVNGAAP